MTLLYPTQLEISSDKWSHSKNIGSLGRTCSKEQINSMRNFTKVTADKWWWRTFLKMGTPQTKITGELWLRRVSIQILESVLTSSAGNHTSTTSKIWSSSGYNKGISSDRCGKRKHLFQTTTSGLYTAPMWHWWSNGSSTQTWTIKDSCTQRS